MREGPERNAAEKEGKVGSSGTEMPEKNAVGKERKEMSFCAEESEARSALPAELQSVLLAYGGSSLNANGTDSSFPGAFGSLSRELGDVFPEEIPPGLPPVRGMEDPPVSIPVATVPNRSAYSSDPEGTKGLPREAEELVAKGRARESSSPFSVPALLVPKKGVAWRVRMDWRAANKIAVKYRLAVPRLGGAPDELHGSIVVSRIDLKSGRHQISVREGDEWKASCETTHGLCAWLVLPCGLTDAPGTFVGLMNHVLRASVGKFVVVYYGGITIYSKNLGGRLTHLHRVLDVLREGKLLAVMEVGTFARIEVFCPGSVLSDRGTGVGEEKERATREWPAPKSITEEGAFTARVALTGALRMISAHLPRHSLRSFKDVLL